MSWHIEVQSSGMFIVATEVGKPMMDGVFRAEVSASHRMKMLHQIAEAPAMEALLRVIRADLMIIISGMEEAVGKTQAHEAGRRLYELVTEIDATLFACSEETA